MATYRIFKLGSTLFRVGRETLCVPGLVDIRRWALVECQEHGYVLQNGQRIVLGQHLEKRREDVEVSLARSFTVHSTREL